MTNVHSNAVVDKSAELGKGVVIGPNVVINSGVSIGDGTVIDANVFIGKDVKIGKGNHIFPNASIGAQPQLLAMGPDDPIGKLEIGDNNILREQVTIHPSMHADSLTKIGNKNFLMIGVHIGHDCVLEDQIVMSNYAQISGHCKIETGVWLSGMVLLHQFITIGRWAYAAGLAGINHDVPPFLIVSGHYPPEVRGVNKRGFSRAGLNETEQMAIYDAYRKLYRTDGPLLEKAKAMLNNGSLDVNVRDMAEAIVRGSEHRYGRYLEQFRD